MASAIGQMGVQKFDGAKKSSGVTRATVGYIAKLAAAIGAITKDEQLLAIGDGLGKMMPPTAAAPVKPEA